MLNHKFRMLRQQKQKRRKNNDDFFDLEQTFNVVDNAAVKQKEQDDVVNLVEDVLDENDPFNDQIRT